MPIWTCGAMDCHMACEYSVAFRDCHLPNVSSRVCVRVGCNHRERKETYTAIHDCFGTYFMVREPHRHGNHSRTNRNERRDLVTICQSDITFNASALNGMGPTHMEMTFAVVRSQLGSSDPCSPKTQDYRQLRSNDWR
jgi:hypothetical protein